MNIGSRIRAARKTAKLTQAQLADLCGYPNQSRVSAYETGEREPSLEDLELLAHAVGLKSGYELLAPTDADHENIRLSEKKRLRESLPVLNYVQAGKGVEAIDICDPSCVDTFVSSAQPHSGRAYALRVEGYSMMKPLGVAGPSFPPDIYIHVDPEKEWRPGDFVVARYFDGREWRTTFKQLVMEEDSPVLMPLNPDRSEYPAIRQEFEVTAKVFDASYGGL